MSSSDQFLNPARAARQLGISTKALRLYEAHGLLKPARSAAAWRAYGPTEMARAQRIADLRAIGLGLREIGAALSANPEEMETILAAHEAVLIDASQRLTAQIRTAQALRGRSQAMAGPPALVLNLPWPWAGGRFELPTLKPLTYIVGPLGSGKTRLAQMIAETIPGAAFLGLDRAAPASAAPRTANSNGVSAALIDQLGVAETPALLALRAGLEAPGPSAFVVDMVEDGLDEPAQRALIAHLRHGRGDTRPLFLMTRSTAILDLASLRATEAVIFCPANHNPPMLVDPIPGAPGFEALTLCLASPAARARLAGGPAPMPAPRHREATSAV